MYVIAEIATTDGIKFPNFDLRVGSDSLSLLYLIQLSSFFIGEQKKNTRHAHTHSQAHEIEKYKYRYCIVIENIALFHNKLPELLLYSSLPKPNEILSRPSTDWW